MEEPIVQQQPQQMEHQILDVKLPNGPSEYDKRILWIRDLTVHSLFFEDNANGLKAFTDCLESEGRKGLTEVVKFLDYALFSGLLIYRPICSGLIDNVQPN